MLLSIVQKEIKRQNSENYRWHYVCMYVVQLAAVRVQLNQVRDELEDCVKQQNFQQAAELKQKIIDLEASRQALIEESQPQSTQTRTEKVLWYLYHLFKFQLVMCFCQLVIHCHVNNIAYLICCLRYLYLLLTSFCWDNLNHHKIYGTLLIDIDRQSSFNVDYRW